MTAREREALHASADREAVGCYAVAVSIDYYPGYLGAALKALAHAAIDLVVKARGMPE